MSGERQGRGSRRVDEVCLVFVPAGGMSAVCEALQQAAGISHIRRRSCLAAATSVWLGSTATHRLAGSIL